MQRVWLIQLPAASVLQRRNSRYRLSGNFESVCSRRGIHGPITFAYYYADYTVTRISSLSRLHLEQLAPSTLSPAPSYRLRRQEKKRSEMEVMMKTPVHYAINIPSSFVFWLNVYWNDSFVARQDFWWSWDGVEVEKRLRYKAFFAMKIFLLE